MCRHAQISKNAIDASQENFEYMRQRMLLMTRITTARKKNRVFDRLFTLKYSWPFDFWFGEFVFCADVKHKAVVIPEPLTKGVRGSRVLRK